MEMNGGRRSLATGDALTLEGVTRRFGALTAIEGISLTVRAGERRAVIGANGVEKIVEVALDLSEKQMFEKSVGSVRDLVEACRKINPALAG